MKMAPWALLCVLAIAACGAAVAQNTGNKVVSTANAPEAIGPYSQAIRAGKILYLAGQIAIDPKTKQLMASVSIEDQRGLSWRI